MLKRLLSPSVFRIQILSFLVIALVPIIFLSINIYRHTWDDEWREIREKHQLLAENLASPLANYVSHFQRTMAIIAETAQGKHLNNPELLSLAKLTQKGFSGLQTISLVDTQAQTLFTFDDTQNTDGGTVKYGDEPSYLKTLKTKQPAISNITLSPTSSKPAIILAQPVFGETGNLAAVLMAELKIDEIERLRSSIHFGVKGHSAIVDSRGHVIAHPNAAWMTEMRDLSHLNIIQEMISGNTGVMEFYSPFVKQNMVAGYTSVPGIGWGVMVPQPMSEVEDQVDAVMASHRNWVIAGFILAVFIALILVYWITHPINLLSNAAKKLSQNSFEGQLPEISKNAPREIKQLSESLNELITSFKASQSEVNIINASLQHRINEATNDLRKANSELQRVAHSDFLTSLANRRHFETELTNTINREHHIDLSLLLIDVDNFKTINDKFGHNAGDAVLIQLSELLNSSMRDDDFLARYGGDEIVMQLRCNAEVARQRAENIRKKVENYEFKCEENIIRTTVSIGFLHCSEHDIVNINDLLKKVDLAMYDAKKAGRNVVIEYKIDG